MTLDETSYQSTPTIPYRLHYTPNTLNLCTAHMFKLKAVETLDGV